ncbi:MAG TPA: UDP-glucose--hexose-1-phosphate uridylyltransferase [Candidatus Acidoferrum sp.]
MDDSWKKPHRRFNPMLREWVVVSPHRTQRPWQGKVEKAAEPSQVQYDLDCYLCPGNSRAGGARNPDYQSTFAFNNDFPALLPDPLPPQTDASSLLRAAPESGICRVVCFSPRHDLTLARMSLQELRSVIDVWAQELKSLEAVPWIRYVQIFENRGGLMGASNPHPHCQIWASSSLPNLPQRELESFEAHQHKHATCLLCDYLELELQRKERIVCENKSFLAIVPFWAVWPFELMILSKRHVGSLLDFTEPEKDQFADLLRRVTIRYDNLFQTSFPYSMGLHQKPCGIGEVPAWHFHAHFVPPLLRSATIQKFMVGYELLASPQRDVTAEDAAARLAGLSEIHYLDST